MFNWNQAEINLVSGTHWTLDKIGNKKIAITGLQDN